MLNEEKTNQPLRAKIIYQPVFQSLQQAVIQLIKLQGPISHLTKWSVQKSARQFLNPPSVNHAISYQTNRGCINNPALSQKQLNQLTRGNLIAERLEHITAIHPFSSSLIQPGSEWGWSQSQLTLAKRRDILRIGHLSISGLTQR